MLRGYKWFVVLYSSPCNVVTYMHLSTVSIIMMRGTWVTHLVARQEQFGLYAPVLHVLTPARSRRLSSQIQQQTSTQAHTCRAFQLKAGTPDPTASAMNLDVCPGFAEDVAPELVGPGCRLAGFSRNLSG